MGRTGTDNRQVIRVSESKLSGKGGYDDHFAREKRFSAVTAWFYAGLG